MHLALLAATVLQTHALQMHGLHHGRPSLLPCTAAFGTPMRAMLRMSGDDEEIAALEERLAGLKRAKEEEASAAARADAPPMAEVKPGFDVSTLSSRKKVAAEQVGAPEELLSEAWKEEETPAAGINLSTIGTAVGLVLALVRFAQVPIGQDTLDLSTYGGKEVRLETSQEIRARYEALGVVGDAE